ncbi:LCP family protein [Nesterenkonia flava]|uniref:LCP family protein n=1 Tax=Nesterenkonia flava TaxID=469799 RepID=UPI0031CFFE90
MDEDGNEVEVEDQQLNILLIGYDVGGGSGESENLAWVPNAGRADTMMWIHIPHERDSVQVMSIMRDTWVTIPGHGEHKINAAFSLGGTATAVHTLESLFGVRIDHVAAVNMYGFQDIVSTLGGVTVNSPVAFTSRDGYQYHGGPQYMNASEALSFVRERRAFDGGDYQRVANQQAFVRGVIGEVLTPGTLANPARVHNLVSGFSPYMTVDQGLGDADYLAEIGWDMRNVRNSDIEFFTLPNNGIGSAGGQSVIWPNYGAIAEAGEAMREGWFDEYASQR